MKSFRFLLSSLAWTDATGHRQHLVMEALSYSHSQQVIWNYRDVRSEFVHSIEERQAPSETWGASEETCPAAC